MMAAVSQAPMLSNCRASPSLTPPTGRARNSHISCSPRARGGGGGEGGGKEEKGGGKEEEHQKSISQHNSTGKCSGNNLCGRARNWQCTVVAVRTKRAPNRSSCV